MHIQIIVKNCICLAVSSENYYLLCILANTHTININKSKQF
jgi:hypothetical protein